MIVGPTVTGRGNGLRLREAQSAKYRTHLDRMERVALSPEASRDFVLDIANSL
ncbi:hypothetical protein ACF09K_02925 [Streptomyces sp. NPDC014882]|uniref:hypothetical protein n=1 Tax=Streptomyces sp. NPDC014882 TaxID=3364927 RepID=UPI0036F9BE35